MGRKYLDLGRRNLNSIYGDIGTCKDDDGDLHPGGLMDTSRMGPRLLGWAATQERYMHAACSGLILWAGVASQAGDAHPLQHLIPLARSQLHNCNIIPLFLVYHIFLECLLCKPVGGVATAWLNWQ